MHVIVHTERGTFSGSVHDRVGDEELERIHGIIGEHLAGRAGWFMLDVDEGKVLFGTDLMRSAVVVVKKGTV